MYVTILLVVVVTISYSSTGYCQIAEEVFDQLDSVEFKWTTRWLSKAYVKSCNYSVQEAITELQKDKMDIWHISANTVELCTSMSNHELKKNYNLQCHEIARLNDLLQLENTKKDTLLNKRPYHMIHSRAANMSSSTNHSTDDGLLTLDWFDEIHNLSVLETWYKELATQYDDLVYINESIGQTERETDIFAIHISCGEKPSNKPKIYFQCLLHAREWISGPVCMYISQYLVKNSDKKQISKLLKELEFILVPVANPDGYAATWFQYPRYRYWRKNLAKLDGTDCIGVDLNRNFDVDWNQAGISPNPCDPIYAGPSAQSELEVQAITAYILANRPIYGAIDFHSYGQLILYPHGWTSNLPVRYKRLKNLAMCLSERVQKVNGFIYTPQSLASIYLASGTFGDWAYKQEVALQNQNTLNVSYRIAPITLELRPKQREQGFLSGFLVDPNDILPTCLEMIPAIKQFSKKLLKKPLRV